MFCNHLTVEIQRYAVAQPPIYARIEISYQDRDEIAVKSCTQLFSYRLELLALCFNGVQFFVHFSKKIEFDACSSNKMQFACFDAIIDVLIGVLFSAALNVLRFWLLLNPSFPLIHATSNCKRSCEYLQNKIRLKIIIFHQLQCRYFCT